MKRLFCGVVAVALTTVGAHADFSYDQNSKITGGAMAAAMKMAGAFSKQARGPIKSTTIVKGNRMAHVHGDTANVIDLDKETVTDIDFAKRTYSVMTFAEYKQYMEALLAKTKDNSQGANVQVNATVKPTGLNKNINGMDTQEFIVTFEMETTDAKSGKSASMVTTADMWIAKSIPGYEEVRDFQKRMAVKLNFTPSSGMGMMSGSNASGMRALANEMSKLDGVPVFMITRMGMKGEQVDEAAIQRASASEQQQQSQPAPDVKGAAGASAERAAQQNVAGAISGRLGRFGGLGGGLGRKKAAEEPKKEEPAPPPPPPPPAAPAANANTGAQGYPASMMIMETEMNNFSRSADTSKMDVPAGFKQVQKEKLK